jgi:hypothetical protein
MTSTTPTSARQARPASIRALTALLVFQGISAVGGGTAFLLDTSGGVAGMSPEVLSGTPFTTYLWPGLLLGAGLGIPALVAAVGVHRRGRSSVAAPLERATGHHWSWSVSLAIGIALMMWIAAQLLLLDERTFLQPLMFAVGAALTALALLPRVREDLEVPRD